MNNGEYLNNEHHVNFLEAFVKFENKDLTIDEVSALHLLSTPTLFKYAKKGKLITVEGLQRATVSRNSTDKIKAAFKIYNMLLFGKVENIQMKDILLFSNKDIVETIFHAIALNKFDTGEFLKFEKLLLIDQDYIDMIKGK